MKARTRGLKRALRQAATVEKKLAVLEGAYAGEDAYILTCGPSLLAPGRDQVARRLRDELVLSVKQAYDDFPELTDFHLVNAFNHKRYRYPRSSAAIVVAGLKPEDPPIFGAAPDLVLPLEPALHERRLAVTRDFERYLLANSALRPWGPGIMYELAIYLTLHLGARNVFALGWDLGPPGATLLRHSYARPPVAHEAPSSFFARVRCRAWAALARRPVTAYPAWQLYRRGQRYNPADPEPDEMALAIESSRSLYEWLRRRSVNLYVVSDQSHLDPAIPRVRFQDL